MLPMFTLTLSDLDNGCWGLAGYTLLNKPLCWEKKRGKVIMGRHKARLKKKRLKIWLFVEYVRFFLCLLKSVKCALCVHEQVHTHTSFVRKQLCILLCVCELIQMIPEVSYQYARASWDRQRAGLQQPAGWDIHCLWYRLELSLIIATHSLTHTYAQTISFHHSTWLRKIEKGRERKGWKEKVKKRRWKMDAKIRHAWRTSFPETRYTQECIPRNKVTVNLMFPAGHKIGIMASRKHYI